MWLTQNWNALWFLGFLLGNLNQKSSWSPRFATLRFKTFCPSQDWQLYPWAQPSHAARLQPRPASCRFTLPQCNSSWGVSLLPHSSSTGQVIFHTPARAVGIPKTKPILWLLSSGDFHCSPDKIQTPRLDILSPSSSTPWIFNSPQFPGTHPIPWSLLACASVVCLLWRLLHILAFRAHTLTFKNQFKDEIL